MQTASAVFLGIDVGTSACKVVAVDGTGRTLGVTSRAYPLFNPQHGWSEQDPQDWWVAVGEGVREVCSMLAGRSTDVKGIGLSGQMHGLVALDTSGAVIRPAILWNDQRCERQCEELTAGIGGLGVVVSQTRNRMLTGFTVGKIQWVKENEPENFDRFHQVMNPKDYLRWRMNGEFITDVSDASGTGLFNVASREWSEPMVKFVGLTLDMLPLVVESTASTGQLLPQVAQDWGLGAGIDVFAGGGDAVIQTLSMGILRPGDIGVTIGTAGIVAAASTFCPENDEANVQVSCYNEPDRWHVMGVSLSAAGSLQWLREALSGLAGGGEVTFEALMEAAAAAPPGCEGLMFLPYLDGERSPHYAPSSSAAWVGLTRVHGLGHLVRSVVEGVLLNMRQILDTFAARGLPCDRIIASGGATRDDLWLQTMADIFGQDVITLQNSSEGAAFGAAVVAGVGSGQWASFEEFFGHLPAKDEYYPDPERVAVYSRVFEGHRKLFDHLVPVYEDVKIARAGD